MNFFPYKDGAMHAEDVPLREIAEQFGTPCYVYSRAAFEHQWRSLETAFGEHPHTRSYSQALPNHGKNLSLRLPTTWAVLMLNQLPN